LLEARVIIHAYNDHCPAPFYPSLHGWFWHHQAYSGLGAGIVMVDRPDLRSRVKTRIAIFQQLQRSSPAAWSVVLTRHS
jgi:hypothetical protein